jgi:hypothetical protein
MGINSRKILNVLSNQENAKQIYIEILCPSSQNGYGGTGRKETIVGKDVAGKKGTTVHC